MAEPKIIKVRESTREAVIRKYHLHETNPPGHWILWSDQSPEDRSIHVVVPPQEALQDAYTMAAIEGAPTIYVHVITNYSRASIPRRRSWGLPPVPTNLDYGDFGGLGRGNYPPGYNMRSRWNKSLE